MNRSILSLVQLPPPVHGAAVMNKMAISCFDEAKNFNNRTISLKFSKSLSDLRKPSFFKFYSVVVIFFKIVIELVFRRPSLVYFTLTPTGGGFLRDCLYVLLIKTMRVKLVYHLHGKGVAEYSKKSFLIAWLYKVVFYNVKVILLAEELHNDISSYVDVKNVIVIPNGMECSGGEGQDSEKDIIKYCFLSNLVEGKGILDFLESYYSLYKNNNNVEAVVIGDYRDDGTELLVQDFLSGKEKGFLESIDFTGPLYNKEKYTALRSSDIFVFPTHIDTFPLVLIEAMAMGMPCVVYDEGATSSMIIDGHAGYVIKKGRTDLLCVAMQKFIDNPELLKQMSQNARLRYEAEYTQEQFKERIVEAIHRLVISTLKDVK